MKPLLLLTLLLTLAGVHSSNAVQNHSDHHETMLVLSPELIARYQIELSTAQSETIHRSKEVLGKIVPDANKTTYIYPRYAGILKSLPKNLGDKVQKGDVLARVESDQSLQEYTILAPFSGYIIKKNANNGEHVVPDKPIYQLADLSSVWVDLFIYRKNAHLVKKGQSVIVFHNNDDKTGVKTHINYVSPIGSEHTQTMLARAVLLNDFAKHEWIPGLYVDARIVISESKVPVAVKNSALQTLNGEQVVFVKESDAFVARHCKIGKVGTEFTEIISGVRAGETYVAENSFLLKAQLEKASAPHSH